MNHKSKKPIAVEYSIKQKAFNIDLLERVVDINKSMVLRGNESEYVIIGIFDEYKKATDYVKLIKEAMRKNLKK